MNLLLLLAVTATMANVCHDVSCVDKHELVKEIERLKWQNDKLRRFSAGEMLQETFAAPGSGRRYRVGQENSETEWSTASTFPLETATTEPRIRTTTDDPASTTFNPWAHWNPQTLRPIPSEFPSTTRSPQPMCSICSSQPCIRGTCYADMNEPWKDYFCDCPYNYQGKNCETLLVCNGTTCGTGATCIVANNQISCVCPLGKTGDPFVSCNLPTVRSCINGDPYFSTFDGLTYNYHGTCPIVFSRPCTNLGNYSMYEVRLRSDLAFPHGSVSYVTEVEVDFYGQTVHIDTKSYKAYLNNVMIIPPFYWPSSAQRNISVSFASNRFTVQNNQNVKIVFGYNDLCLEVPNVSPFIGEFALCAPAGNIDGKSSDDIKYPDGKLAPTSGIGLLNAVDSWMTHNFAVLSPPQGSCIPGSPLFNLTDCRAHQQDAANICDPIRQASQGLGMFGMCQGLGSGVISAFYADCTNDVCFDPNLRCNSFTEFVARCQDDLMNVDVGQWRLQEDCPMLCMYNSHYKSCKSACPATCADIVEERCDKGCVEGCECDPGTVLDETILSPVHCIPVETCGCTDENGSPHDPDSPWLTNLCTTSNECINGTQVTKENECGMFAECDIIDGKLACVCMKGFTGDGYHCDDIDECQVYKNESICNEGNGQGICHNTNGSYYCECINFYEGSNCEDYRPRRDCADYLIYHHASASGTYDIFVDGNANNKSVKVYCDQVTDGGGYTMISGAITNADVNENKTLQQYQEGFGNPALQTVWIGLDNLVAMTTITKTSLLLSIKRCARNTRPEKSSVCVYPEFKVLADDYRVYIPQECEGSETENTFYDGWVRWNLSLPGPAFTAFNSNGTFASCSANSLRTGFWFYEDTLPCGPANLNGVRTTCDVINKGGSAVNKFLMWNGEPVEDVSLFVRPALFPNYDPIPPATNAPITTTTVDFTTWHPTDSARTSASTELFQTTSLLL